MWQAFYSLLWIFVQRAVELSRLVRLSSKLLWVGLYLWFGALSPSPRVWAQSSRRCSDWRAAETLPRLLQLPEAEVRFGFENRLWNDLKQSFDTSKRSLAFIPLLRAFDTHSQPLPDLVLGELQRRMKQGWSSSSNFPEKMSWWQEYPIFRSQFRGALVQSEVAGRLVRLSLPEHDLLTAEFNSKMQPQESGRFAIEMLSEGSLRRTREFIVVYEDNTLNFGQVQLSPLENPSAKKDPYSTLRQRTSRFPGEGDTHYQNVLIADQPGLHLMMIRSALFAHEKNLLERRERLLSVLAIQNRELRQKKLDPFDLFLFSPKPEGAKAALYGPSRDPLSVVYDFNLNLMNRWAPALRGIPFGLINVKDFSAIYESILEDVLSSRLRADAKSYFLKLNSNQAEAHALEQRLDYQLWKLRQQTSDSDAAMVAGSDSSSLALAHQELSELRNRLEILDKQAQEYRSKLYRLTGVPSFDSEVQKFLRDFEANLVLLSRARRLRLGVRGFDPGATISPEQLDALVQQVLQQLNLP